jgi:predicted nucleic acid-binding protein
MVLVDTSVWVSHLRGGKEPSLVKLLDDGAVFCHPFIIGELACGNLKNRTTVISLLEALPVSRVAEHREILLFIENHSLQGKGLGYIDIHLLASATLTGIPLWTLDKQLKSCAHRLQCAYKTKSE